MLKRLLLLVAALCAAPALAQTPAAAPPAAETARVKVETSEGSIVLELEKARAPITTANFLRYVDEKRLDGTVFYRTVRVTPTFGFVQFGVQNAPKRVLPPIKHEPTTQTGVRHVDGAISIARLAPGTAQGDFTISVGAQPSLDADPSREGDNLGYAAFGRVIEGMEVIHRILNAPVSEGGHFKGEMIADPVRILSARRID
ncbi:peptidylprolyl isomerase [Sphingomonas desiccabilis]|uniref:peptidylprolyl isomerase n=1 Tax=Sphingomonas desiccabilis TaxID=429134 RepID=A0A4Q2IWC5_9SPHN|nr:peptidylprolyl isomerase [Sphingomonas desiccabilis]MBB3910234.1 peptidyl-prolyl cis-trans isomerase A (cyclophilin A) [Sphingomonas desiccabilis]RXZ34905.1 peptidylprolyl isomerase [Sphingomonas desiccabilis]